MILIVVFTIDSIEDCFGDMLSSKLKERIGKKESKSIDAHVSDINMQQQHSVCIDILGCLAVSADAVYVCSVVFSLSLFLSCSLSCYKPTCR